MGFERQKPLPIIYKNKKLDCGYRLDIVVEDEIILEPQKRAHSPLLAAGLASESKNSKLPYGRRFPAACGGELQLKSCDKIEPIHKAQLLTYLKLSGLHLGLILNFNVPLMRDGIVRIVNELDE